MKLHEKIREIRKAKGLPQSTVAYKLGITVSGYNMKEKGHRPINTDELVLIAQVLEVPASIFFEDEFHVKLNKESYSA